MGNECRMKRAYECDDGWRVGLVLDYECGDVRLN